MLWLLASTALVLCTIPCVVLVMRGNVVDRIVALQLSGLVVVLALLAFEQGEGRQSFFDLSLALAVMTFPSGLLVAQVFRRWL